MSGFCPTFFVLIDKFLSETERQQLVLNLDIASRCGIMLFVKIWCFGRFDRMTKKPEYNNESMTLLKGPDKVRKRPAVIFGSDGLDGCQHAAFEIISNSIDEAREGYGNKIIIKNDNYNCENIFSSDRIPRTFFNIAQKTGLGILSNSFLRSNFSKFFPINSISSFMFSIFDCASFRFIN